MHITRLHAENIKRIKVVTITPDGNVVQIRGANGSGKTSVLDAIMFALGGTRAIDSEPVRRGASKGLVTLDLGDMIVSRRFTDEGTTALRVEGKDGNEFTSPQKLLDGLLGKLAFDPLEFLDMKPAEQLALLRTLVTVDVDLDKLAGANQRDYNTRTDINRDAKALRAQADAITVAEGLPAKPVDLTDLLNRITTAAEHNGLIEQRKARRNALAAEIARLRGDADHKAGESARLRAEAARLIGLADEADKDVVATRDRADAEQARLESAPALPEPVDAAELRRQHDTGAAVNAAIAERERKASLRKQAEAKEAEAAALSDAMAARDKQRADAIAAAKMPVPGLGFGEGGVTMNGLPFEQASGAEQLRTSLAVAMAMNPKLRVVRIKDGSLLDENGLRLVAEMAEANDFQVWMEIVDSSGKVGIVMEDGMVKGAEPEAE